MAEKFKDNPALKKQIINTLASFEKIKEWADVGHWLQKIAKQLEEYKNPNIPEKITFSKRLAQCLNPTLPHGVHLNALQVYKLIFLNMKQANQNWADDIALFSIGLFPFFQFAAFQVKPVVLDILREHFFPLERQLIPCVSGLVVSILPGLDEQNEELRKNVQRTLDMACECVGRRYFIGAVWLSVLRTPKVRIAGLKYLSKKIEKQQDLDELHINENIDDDYQPNQESLNNLKVFESLPQEKQINNIIGNGDQNLLDNQTQILGGDISMIQDPNEENYEQNNPQISQEIKEKQSMILTALERGINDDNDENNYPNKNSLVINALISCLEDENLLVKRHTLDFLYSHFKLQYDLFSDDKKIILIEATLYLLIKKDLSVTRRIYTWLFGPPDLENKYNLTDKNQFVLNFIIVAFRNIFEIKPKSSVEATMPLKILQNFYMEHEHLVESTLKELSLYIIKYIYVNHKGSEFSAEVMKSGERFMENLPSNFGLILNSLSEVMSSEISKKNDAKCLEILHLVEFAFEKLLIQQEGSDKIRQIDYIKVLISGIFRTTASLTAEDITKFSFILPAVQLALKLIDNLNRNLEALGPDYEIDEDSQEINNQFEANIMIYCKYFTKVADYIFERDEVQDLHQRYQSVFYTQCKLIIKIQKYISTFTNDLPEWFLSVVGCIKSVRPQISLPACEGTIEILLNDKNIPVLLNIKNELINELKQRTGIKKQNASIGKIDVIKLLIQKLWSLLDHNYYIGKVIDLITSFQNIYTEVFSDMLATSFTSANLVEKELAIRRFGTFWKLTGEQQNYKNIYIVDVALFNMLEFLENDNPLLRLSCKTWLVDSMPQLFRILDPIFEVLMKPSNLWYVTSSRQYFYTKEYDTKRVHDAFKKLKSILITAGEFFVKYITSINISEKIKDLRMNFGTENELTSDTQCTYLELLVIMCLRYISGQAVESLSTKFYFENSTVNATSCEFLELLIKRLELSDLSLKVTYSIIEPTLYLVSHSNINEDYVLQVQLLSLMKTILFQSQFQNLKNKLEISNLLSSKMFIPNFLKGLDLKLPSYLRVQFIDFITSCVKPLTKYLKHPELTNAIKQILLGFFTVIIKKKEEGIESDLDIEDNNKIVELALSTDKSNELKGLADDNTKGTLFLNFETEDEGQNETAILLDSIKQILLKFLSFQDPNVFTQNQQDRNDGGVLLSMKDWIFGTSVQTTQIDPKELEFSDTRISILNELIKIIQNYLLCWKTSRQIKECADFSQQGIAPYSFDKFKDFNKSLTGTYQLIAKFPNSIKSQILSVVKPLSVQYNTDFFNAILNLWMGECSIGADNTIMTKLIDILICMKISPENFINSLSRTTNILTIVDFYEKKKKENKKLPYILHYELGLAESRVLFLLYTFLNYVQTDADSLHRTYLTVLWIAFMKFLRIFQFSRHPNTQLWLLEVIYIASQKYSPKEIINDNKIKKELHDITNSLLTQVAQISVKQHNFYYNEPQSQESQPGRYKLIQPYPPTIYGIYKDFKQNENSNKLQKNEQSEQDQDFEIEKIMFFMVYDTSELGLTDRYRFFCLKTLKNLGLSILQNTYSPERTDRIVVRTKEFMEYIFPLLEKKDKHNQLFLECASEILYQQLEIGRMFLMKEFKRYILDIFLANDFFKCNKRTLKLWSRIIDWLVTMDKGDLFSEMLNKVSSFSFIFGRDTETKQKIKNFERVCFMIYSGDRDKYQGKLRILLEKMSEVIKNAENSSPALLILIMFCIRILILRLSSTTLAELFRNIWPMLLTLLITTFNKKNTAKNPNLILAALKLIELISIIGLEEFYLHQWVFVFDYFGLDMEYYNSKDKTNVSQSTGSQIKRLSNNSSYHSPFTFQPYITNSIPEDFILNYVNKQREVQTSYSKRPRAIIMTQTNVIDDVEIKNKALALCQYLISNNEFRAEVDPLQVESLIEGDFISLDDYIFDIN